MSDFYFLCILLSFSLYHNGCFSLIIPKKKKTTPKNSQGRELSLSFFSPLMITPRERKRIAIFKWSLHLKDLACCDSRGRKELDMTERLNWTELAFLFLCYQMSVNFLFSHCLAVPQPSLINPCCFIHFWCHLHCTLGFDSGSSILSATDFFMSPL